MLTAPPLPLFHGRILRQQRMYSLVMYNHKQVIIDSFKYCELTVTTNRGEDLLIHCLKITQDNLVLSTELTM